MMDDALRRCLDVLETAVGDPRSGLPEDVFRFVSRITPLINVDLLIQDDRSRTLLTWRDDEFYGSGWHVPCGIIRYKESAADRIRACARAELGADVSSDPASLVVLEDIREQATRGHHISLLFRCRLLGPPDVARQAVSDRRDPVSGAGTKLSADLLEEQRDYARFF
jgi:colanic acid biosynthesis protein WcaH